MHGSPVGSTVAGLAIAVDSGPGPPRQQPPRVLPAARRHGPKPARLPAQGDRPSRRLASAAHRDPPGNHGQVAERRQPGVTCTLRSRKRTRVGVGRRCRLRPDASGNPKSPRGDAEDPGPALKFRRWRAGKKTWNAYFLRRPGAPLRGRLAARVCRFAHSLNLFVRGLPAPPRVHRVPASQLSRTRV